MFSSMDGFEIMRRVNIRIPFVNAIWNAYNIVPVAKTVPSANKVNSLALSGVGVEKFLSIIQMMDNVANIAAYVVHIQAYVDAYRLLETPAERKYGFQRKTISNRLTTTPISMPLSPHIHPKRTERPRFRHASAIGAHTSWKSPYAFM